MFICVGLSHKQAPIAVRELLAVPADALPERLRLFAAIGGVREVVLLSTCNRVELFAAVEAVSAGADLLAALGQAAAPHALVRQGDEALRHLFRVAASLDSMVVGEAQILGQLKEAWALAQAEKAVGAQLDRVVARAIGSAKRVRTETAIARGAVSISSVAVELAGKALGDLRGSTALLLGAGEMAQLAARELQAAGAKELLVVNRSPARAEQLAREVSGIPASLEELPHLLERADVVLCSAAVQTPLIIHAQMLRVIKARRYRPLFLVDLALPRNVDPAVNQLENVFVYDLDDLEKVAAQNRGLREGEVERAEQIVEEELQSLLRELRERTGAPVLARLRAQAQAIAEAEIAKTLPQLAGLTEKQEKSVRAMALAIVNKLMHAPTQQLRAEAAAGRSELLRAAGALFDLPPEPPADAAPAATPLENAAAPLDTSDPRQHAPGDAPAPLSPDDRSARSQG